MSDSPIQDSFEILNSIPEHIKSVMLGNLVGLVKSDEDFLVFNSEYVVYKGIYFTCNIPDIIPDGIHTIYSFKEYSIKIGHFNFIMCLELSINFINFIPRDVFDMRSCISFIKRFGSINNRNASDTNIYLDIEFQVFLLCKSANIPYIPCQSIHMGLCYENVADEYKWMIPGFIDKIAPILSRMSHSKHSEFIMKNKDHPIVSEIMKRLFELKLFKIEWHNIYDPINSIGSLPK